MIVLFDYQVFEEQKIGGISRYFYELYKHFDIDQDISIQLPINYSENIYLKSINKYKDLPPELIHPYQKFIPGLKFRGKRKLYSFFSRKVYSESNLERAISTLKTNEYDIFHPTYYNPYFLDIIKMKPLVITVHDMTTEMYPEYFPEYDRTSDRKKLITKRADKIIAVSESTKNDLINLLGISTEKIEVIYHGSSLNITSDSNNIELKLPRSYLLYVGKRTLYKNFTFFIESIKNVLVKNPELKIICTGQPFSDSEKQYFRLNNIENNLIHYFIDDILLSKLYSSAIAFVFPSLYEGFGIPVLEAFSCGCPCILSNTSSLPEVGGDAAIYFDPRSSESIQSAVTNVLQSNEVQNDLRLKGYEQLKKFSWSNSAAKTKEIYKKLI